MHCQPTNKSLLEKARSKSVVGRGGDPGYPGGGPRDDYSTVTRASRSHHQSTPVVLDHTVANHAPPGITHGSISPAQFPATVKRSTVNNRSTASSALRVPPDSSVQLWLPYLIIVTSHTALHSPCLPKPLPLTTLHRPMPSLPPAACHVSFIFRTTRGKSKYRRRTKSERPAVSPWYS